MASRSGPAHRGRKPSIWFEVARRAALALPGVQERMSLTGPVFRIGQRRLAWLGEDGVSLLVPIGADEGEMLSEAEPRTFSAAGQLGGHPLLRVHLAYVVQASLRRLLEQAWRERASKQVQRSRSRASAERQPRRGEEPR
ncbi:MmcQ/YjbR family DNA-binding protein [Methylobacterium nigriterrae]|uniref:MmcQ/YjbR family DNA-binding protein n=1 Tax=Methylobacterium nigriterrae TaxID=3127512 RepID=UPI003013E66C